MKKCFLILFMLITAPVFAANTTGYAWSESVGWFDFSNVTVADTAVTGYAYNDNTGWLVLDGVTNTNGVLGGYAWSESVGWFDFSNVSIQSFSFKGYAYNDNTGWLSFENGTNVTTTWPSTTPPPPAPPILPAGSSWSGGSTPTVIPDVLLRSSSTTLDIHLKSSKIKIPNIKRTLCLNMKGEDVKWLQQFLNSQGFILSKTGPGSPGFETNKFGSLTKKALIKFQIENNIKPSVGMYGPITKGFVEKLLLKN